MKAKISLKKNKIIAGRKRKKNQSSDSKPNRTGIM